MTIELPETADERAEIASVDMAGCYSASDARLSSVARSRSSCAQVCR